jgi:3',5'-cyclic AMP phosphodiesterase CpdA
MMPELIWMSDIHLNFLTDAEIDRFFARIAATPHDGILVGGDVAEGPTFSALLERLAGMTERPVYFVLGNHDSYRGSLAGARRDAARLDGAVANLHWLPAQSVVPLDDEMGLLGHGCWGDGRNGEVETSNAMLNDWIVIDELSELPRDLRLERLAELGDEGAAHLRRWLPEALERFAHVVVLTHVPPFATVNMRGAQPIDPEYLPFYTCGAAGAALEEAMRARPDRRMTVLSGHTHGAGRYEILPNLVAHTVGSRYGEPRFVRAPLSAGSDPGATRDM